MERCTKAEVIDNIEDEIQIKTKTTKQILKDLEYCLGLDKRTKVVIQMYADYIELFKRNKIKIGNLNMLLYCNGRNYNSILEIIRKLLYKEGITKTSQYKLLTDVHIIRNTNIGCNELYVVNDESLKDYKLEKLISDNPSCVFIVICNDNNIKMIENIKNKFTWEISINEPTEQEKVTYIKNTIKEHGFECKVSLAELRAITDYDMESIDSFLIGAILRANKKKLTYISKEELHIMKRTNYKEGMKKLNSLVGLDDVKEQVQQILNYVKVHKERGTMPTLNMVFKGNPRNWKNRSSKNNCRNICRQ